MNREDLRYIKTDNLIKNTFRSCIKELGFEKTTVSEIWNRCTINRGTFYMHYEDKYDLLNSFFSNFENAFI